jgi:hypothetical protein
VNELNTSCEQDGHQLCGKIILSSCTAKNHSIKFIDKWGKAEMSCK